ncbi:hypothetical protein LIER_41053 [Lithospermum erythrorhizon]|uniref:Uncharacterized protein n=1 Tax=Lithospermum erythrorhizon TaxID=34254 RepID=A0AAV3R9D9_LITER
MPTIETVGLYYRKLAKEFIYNMAEDIDDAASPNFQKIVKMLTGGVVDTWLDKGQIASSKLSVKYAVLHKFIFDQVVQHAQSQAVLEPIVYPSMLCSILESQKEDLLTAEDVEGLAPCFITISPKLMQGTHVADIPLQAMKLVECLEVAMRRLAGS